MKKEECCSIFMTTLMIAIPIVAVIILIVYVFGIVAVPKDKTTYDFIKDHGSLIAGMIAFGAAIIALYSQKQSTQKQIHAQRILEAERLWVDKLEETYEVVEGLRIKAMLIRPHMVKDPVLDIDILHHDLSKVIMLCRLHNIVDYELFAEYKKSVEMYLTAWSNLARKRLDSDNDTQEDIDKFNEGFSCFINSTNQFLSYLTSLRRL